MVVSDLLLLLFNIFVIVYCMVFITLIWRGGVWDCESISILIYIKKKKKVFPSKTKLYLSELQFTLRPRYSLELRFFILEHFRQRGVVNDELFELDGADGRHQRVDVRVFREHSFTHVLRFDYV